MRSRLRTRSALISGLAAAAIVASGCSTHFIVARATPSVADSAGQELPQFPAPPASPDLPRPTTMAEVPQFITAVFNDAQAAWQRVFAAAGVAYTPAKLTLFSSNVNTGCGVESAATGPFYCPTDLTVYLDVSFFDGMEKRYGLTGDFAQAYVVAHEVGHHVQRITGLTGEVQQLQQRNPGQANALSVLTELQADCYAGVWAYSTYQRGLLQPGDIDDALNAAAVVGDDFLQTVHHRHDHPREMDARFIGAASEVADHRLQHRPARRLRHVQPVKLNGRDSCRWFRARTSPRRRMTATRSRHRSRTFPTDSSRTIGGTIR